MNKMNKKGLLLVISGPSGVGKGTVLAKYKENAPQMKMSVSATTRNPRPGEEHGREYYFVTKEQFEKAAVSGEMLEYASYSGNFYGTPKKAVYDKLNEGFDVVLEIEIQGAMQIKNKCPEAVLIFILPPSYEELENRLLKRQTETPEAVEKRMETAKKELLAARNYDYVIVNDDIEKAAEKLNYIIEGARCLSSQNQNILESIEKSIK